MEFSLLIFLQKQIFAPKVILPSWKSLLCKPRGSPSTMGSMYRKRRNSLSTGDCHEEMVPTSNNTNGGSQGDPTVAGGSHPIWVNREKNNFKDFKYPDEKDEVMVT